MLTFDQCLGIRDACICIKNIVKRSRHRRLSTREREDLYYQLARIETWLNTHPTLGERLYARAFKKWRKIKTWRVSK